MRSAELLSLVAKLNPAAWDAINPHGHRVFGRADLVALNPQPLPPEPPPDIALIGAAEMAHALVNMAVAAEFQGNASGSMLAEWIDEWCGTPWPRRWPWPWPNARLGDEMGRADLPRPDPVSINEARLVGAMVFASAASRLGDSEIQQALLDGADKLTEVALGRQTISV